MESQAGKPLTPIKAIRANCVECCCGSSKAVRECHIETCALWPYRMGRRPGRLLEPGASETNEVGTAFLASRAGEEGVDD